MKRKDLKYWMSRAEDLPQEDWEVFRKALHCVEKAQILLRERRLNESASLDAQFVFRAFERALKKIIRP